MRYIRVEIPMGDWHLVDGTADNSISMDVEDWDVVSVIHGSCVRDAGWRAAAEFHGLDDARVDWPAEDQVLAVTLKEEDWAWTVAQLDRWDMGDGQADAVRARIVRALDRA